MGRDSKGVLLNLLYYYYNIIRCLKGELISFFKRASVYNSIEKNVGVLFTSLGSYKCSST